MKFLCYLPTLSMFVFVKSAFNISDLNLQSCSLIKLGLQYVHLVAINQKGMADIL